MHLDPLPIARSRTLAPRMSSRPGERPEIDLLLLCARRHLDPGTTDRVRTLVTGGLDAPLLMRLAGRHGLLPLVHAHLESAARDLVPAAMLQPLRAASRQIAARNLYATGELHRLLDLLAAHGISGMPYKGPALAALL